MGSGEEKADEQMDARRMAKKSVSKEEMGNFSFFFFSLLSPLLGGGGLSRERRLAAHPKKAFDEKESTCTKALHIPPCSRAQFALCVSPCVETTTSHGPSRWTNQNVANISKSPFFPSTPAKIKKGYIQALDFSKSPLFNCHVFCPPLDSFPSSRFPPPLQR